MVEMFLLFIVGDAMEYWQSSQLPFIRARNVCGLHRPRSAHKQMKMKILSVFQRNLVTTAPALRLIRNRA